MDDFAESVTDRALAGLPGSPGWAGWRLGLVLPKKQARRSVTRSLIRHQVRDTLRRHAAGLAAHVHDPAVQGWVVRLRAPFDRGAYPSAASEALKAAVRQELDELWRKVSTPRMGKARAAEPGQTPPVKGAAASSLAPVSQPDPGKAPRGAA